LAGASRSRCDRELSEVRRRNASSPDRPLGAWKITVDALTRRDALTRFSGFMPAEEAEAVLRFLDDAAAGNSPATGAVERILGRPAMPFDIWAAGHAADFR
jgi:hypothetical protein